MCQWLGRPQLDKKECKVIVLCYVGSSSHLLAYESERQRENIVISGGCDGLYRLFSTHIPPIVAARSLGLQLTNACTPLKVSTSISQSPPGFLSQFDVRRGL